MEATLLRAEPRRSVPSVAKERLKSPRVRLFVALDLPDDVRFEIEAWQARECIDEALRPIAPKALHMTLCFLGWRPEKAVPEIATIVTGVKPHPVPMSLEPDPSPIKGRRPGLFALDAPSEAATELQGELEARLAERRFYKPEKRPFWPHLTVARVKPEARGSRKPALVTHEPHPLPEHMFRFFRPSRLVLYRSHLRPTGAEYEPMAELELPTAEDEEERGDPDGR